MTVKDFFKGVFYLPATTFSVLADLLLGSYRRDTNGKILPAPKGKPNTNSGLLGFILGAVMYVARGVSNFIYNHKTAIATAFWLSLVVAGAAALTVFLWPAALAAVANFAIYGLSIAGLVGAGSAAQIGVIAALTFAATSVATYVVAGFINTINWIRSCFTKPNSQENELNTTTNSLEETKDVSASKLSVLSSKNPNSTVKKDEDNVVPMKKGEEPPKQTPPLFTKKDTVEKNPGTAKDKDETDVPSSSIVGNGTR